MGWPCAPVAGEIGDVRFTIKPFGPAGQSYFCAQGLAFDGTSLYLSRCGYSVIDVIVSPGNCPQAPVTCPIDRSFDAQIPEGVSGLAFDAKRNGLWIGTQAGLGRDPFGGCGSVGVPIYFWAFNGPGDADDAVSFAYTVPRNLLNPATMQRVFRSCNLTGLAYRENDPSRSDDDELWIVEEKSHEILKFRLDGSCPTEVLNANCASGFDARMVDPSLTSACGGLGTSTEKLSLATASCEVCIPQGIDESDVFRSIETANGFQGVDQLVADVLRWKADMECDPITFSPVTVMWVRTSPQGNSANDLITAYEVEPESCDNVSLGACCDANQGTCRNNTPQGSCAGSWHQGVDCDELTEPCFQAHMIVVLDRTGSMQAIRLETGNTRCIDAVAAADYDIRQFFAAKPPGSSVAIWTFRASGPMPLTNGFVDEATALADLHTLDGLPCSNLTPLAGAVCAAIDFMVGEFPLASPQTLKVAISSDGEENNSSGPCLGPSASGGTTCDDFTAGSWQKKVCDHVEGKATAIVRYWSDFETGSFVTGETELDVETGMLRAASVSDTTFFQALTTATGGTFQIVGDVAADPLGPSGFGVVGACCLPSGACQESTTQAECVVLGGTHQGDASLCADATGACCLPDGTCQNAITQSDCTGQGGSFQGTCTMCAAHVVGACCLPDETCQDAVTQAACTGQGGLFQGACTICEVYVIGGCCLPNGTCQDGMTPSDCAAQSGTQQGPCTVCTGEPGECPAPIPAVSDWGMILLSLLVLGGGTIILGQRGRAGAEVE